MRLPPGQLIVRYASAIVLGCQCALILWQKIMSNNLQDSLLFSVCITAILGAAVDHFVCLCKALAQLTSQLQRIFIKDRVQYVLNLMGNCLQQNTILLLSITTVLQVGIVGTGKAGSQAGCGATDGFLPHNFRVKIPTVTLSDSCSVTGIRLADREHSGRENTHTRTQLT